MKIQNFKSCFEANVKFPLAVNTPLAHQELMACLAGSNKHFLLPSLGHSNADLCSRMCLNFPCKVLPLGKCIHFPLELQSDLYVTCSNTALKKEPSDYKAGRLNAGTPKGFSKKSFLFAPRLKPLTLARQKGPTVRVHFKEKKVHNGVSP